MCGGVRRYIGVARLAGRVQYSKCCSLVSVRHALVCQQGSLGEEQGSLHGPQLLLLATHHGS